MSFTGTFFFLFFDAMRKIDNSLYELRHTSLSVRPSFRVAQFGCHWTVIYKILYWVVLLKCAHKIKIWFTSDENNKHFI